MKILFFISVYSHGRGGHAHSLNHISKKIGEQNEVKIISLGPGNSNIIESNPYFLEHIAFNGLNLLYLKNKIDKLTRKFKPDIYHCFDDGAYNIIRLLISSRKNKIIVNKCGGKNPLRYPNIKNIILFSNENLTWFKNQKKYQSSNIYLIPNRVKALLNDVNFQPIKKGLDEFVFLRICRIGSSYNKSIIDSISLIEKLLTENITNVKLYVIGVIEDYNLYEKLKTNTFVQNGRVIFLTEPMYTTEAAKMLYLADAVIGTGRGLMEASSLSIPLLAIDKEGSIPVLLDNDNFLDAFNTNFSERNIFYTIDHDYNMKNIINLIQIKSYYDEMSIFSKKVYDEYFNIDKASQAYSDVYALATFGKKNIIADFSLIIRTFVKFYRSYLKFTNK